MALTAVSMMARRSYYGISDQVEVLLWNSAVARRPVTRREGPVCVAIELEFSLVLTGVGGR